LFDAGRTGANVHMAEQDYTAAVATYRQTVLSAMEEVENGITGLTSLDRAATQANASVDSAQRAFDIANERYKGGVAVYLDVLTGGAGVARQSAASRADPMASNSDYRCIW